MPSSGGGGMPEFAQGMMGIDPMRGIGLQSQLAQMNAKERVKIDSGQTIGSYQGGKFVPDYTAQISLRAGLRAGRTVFKLIPDG